MDQIFNLLLGSFDFAYMLSVNILTYCIIKVVDELNGPKKVPTWVKRFVAVVVGLLLILILYLLEVAISQIYIYSFIASLISWDVVFKPLLKYFKHLDYKNEA